MPSAETLNILVTLDENYVPPLRTMLKSLFLNNPAERFDVYMAFDEMPGHLIEGLSALCRSHGCRLIPLRVDGAMFAEAPIVRYYSRAMYFRLLAAEILPDDLDRALYLDPDTLIVNQVRSLYEIDLSDHLFAAAMHDDPIGLTKHINRIRLGVPDASGYYNSGVLLLNLRRQRREIRRSDIFEYVREHEAELLLPDQDVLNALYANRILPLDETLYNYDARGLDWYYMTSNGEKNADWVMRNTVVLHFCGKNKPWKKSDRSRFGILYKHYMCLTERDTTSAR